MWSNIFSMKSVSISIKGCAHPCTLWTSPPGNLPADSHSTSVPVTVPWKPHGSRPAHSMPSDNLLSVFFPRHWGGTATILIYFYEFITHLLWHGGDKVSDKFISFHSFYLYFSIFLYKFSILILVIFPDLWFCSNLPYPDSILHKYPVFGYSPEVTRYFQHAVQRRFDTTWRNILIYPT